MKRFNFKKIDLRNIDRKKLARFAPLIIILLVILVSFATCSRQEQPVSLVKQPHESIPPQPKPEPEPEPEETEPEETEPEDDPYDGPLNPLTGLPVETDISQNRPLAIMINNVRAALPLLGVSQADIIYELLVEGGSSRMLAIFQDVTDVGNIGSIRSIRPYYVDLAQSYDAIFIYAGGSRLAYNTVSNRGITRLDGTYGMYARAFFRDAQRRRDLAFEHSLLTSGNILTEQLPTFDFRLELPEDYERALEFTEDAAPEGGQSAKEVIVRFSSAKSTSFAFDENDGLYYASQFDGPLQDGNNRQQVSVTNILVLRTAVSNIPNDAAGRLNIRTTGSGTGYFINGGKHIEIQWSRENDSSQFVYTHGEGDSLVLGRGKTYICIVPNASEIVFN